MSATNAILELIETVDWDPMRCIQEVLAAVERLGLPMERLQEQLRHAWEDPDADPPTWQPEVLIEIKGGNYSASYTTLPCLKVLLKDWDNAPDPQAEVGDVEVVDAIPNLDEDDDSLAGQEGDDDDE